MLVCEVRALIQILLAQILNKSFVTTTYTDASVICIYYAEGPLILRGKSFVNIIRRNRVKNGVFLGYFITH